MTLHRSDVPTRGPTATVTATAAAFAAAATIGWSDAVAAPAGGYADLVEQVAPAVVFIEVTSVAPEGPAGLGSLFGRGNPLEEFFERFGIPLPEHLVPEQPGRQQPAPPRMGVGSGFIIDAGGDIVTNNHVVANAAEVVVRLDDGRSFEAEVVGTDSTTDLALLRIDAGEDLPFVSFGDSAGVRPGDNVIAVGNPFGLGGSVTAGIVSAVARDINVGPYDDFIQIDAAINRGNSGGPLFNEEGEVIGVNTAIFSPTGGNVGIGFAVPANIARDVIAQLDATGTVERGWLGVQLQPLSPELAEALGLPDERGALIADVNPDGPAAEAGIAAGDVIRSFAGTTIEELRDLPRLVAAAQPGEEVEVGIHRDGEETTITVEIASLDAQRAAADPPTAEPTPHDESDAPSLGIAVAPLDEENRLLAGIDEDVRGVLVMSVDPDGPSAGQLRAGDVITAVQGEPVDAPGALAAALEAERERDAVLLRVWRDGTERFVGLRPRTV